MRAHIPGRYAALALLLGGLACAGNKANEDGTVVAQDTTRAQDTSAYKGMERDTTAIPAPSPTDTTSYKPAPAPANPSDSASSSGVGRADTLTGQPSANQPAPAPTPSADSSSWSNDSTSGMTHDSSSAK
jgi:hypothetical protein